MTNKFTLPKGAEWYNKSKGIYIERLVDRTPEWHEKRTQGIGGSECGNVLGLNDNPGGSVIELFYQKIGMKPSVLKDNNYMLMGRILEDTVANLWQYYSGDMNSVIENMNSGNVVRKCRNVNGVLTNIKYPHLFLNLDKLIEKNQFNLLNGEIMPENSALEIKTASSWVARKWETNVPPQYIAQITQGCMILDVPYGEIAVLELDNRILKVYPIEPSADLISGIEENTRAFWFDMVIPARELYNEAIVRLSAGDKLGYDKIISEITRYEPPADGSDSYKDFLNSRWNSQPIELRATDDITKCAKELVCLKKIADETKKHLQLRENIIRDFLQENDTLILDEGKITWKSQADNKRVMRTASFKPFGITELSNELSEMINHEVKTQIR